MLLITQQQLAVFAQTQQHKFAKNVSEFCKLHLPERYTLLSDEANLSNIVSSITQANEIGLCWQNNIATICVLDMKFQTSVLSNNVIREHILDSNDPDIHFRHLFSEPTSAIWLHLGSSHLNKTANINYAQ